ncbi:MAG: MarR family winged helix-turn-helix transcriptional regulator [Armatimonadota bacterium]
MARRKKDCLTRILDALPQIFRSLAPRRPLLEGETEFTIAQMRALRVVADQGSCTMGELAKALGVSLSSATGLVDRLVERHLVQRTESPRDRRVVRVELSPVGKRTRSRMRKAVLQRLALAEQRLSGAQLEQVAESMELLQRALDETER